MLAKAKHTVPAYQREKVPFLGLNRSDDTREGEFSYQKNMSGRRYPHLSPRLPRGVDERAGTTDALFHWDGHEIIAENGSLYLDGESVANVTAGAKQFAVVNTKLVVWPDGLLVDLTERETTKMEAQVVNNGMATFTTSSVTMNPEKVYASTTIRYASNTNAVPWIWTYSEVNWDAENGWTLDGGAWVSLFDRNASLGRYYIPGVKYNDGSGTYSVKNPDARFAISAPTSAAEPGNDIGFYGVLTKQTELYQTADYGWCSWDVSVFWEQQANVPLSEVFAVGDVVSVSGSAYGFFDVEKRKIVGINEETNTMQFADDTFPAATAIYKAEADVAFRTLRYYAGDRYKYFDFTPSDEVSVEKDLYVVLYEGDLKAVVYELKDKDWKEKRTLSLKSVSEGNPGHQITMQRLTQTEEKITITRDAPEFDFICEHENRLWGVSSKEKTIYASALGDPTNFYDYSGDSGSYAVAVGSEGDFTGICSYGGAVLCWKERTLHKMLGDVPSNYQMATLLFSGVRTGAHKSLVNVNETLFFLGVDGVYAYTGNKPSLISRALGTDVLKDGVGGTDGRAYYLSVKNGDVWELLTYDTHTGLWTRSDELQVVDFSRSGDDLKFLSGNSVYTIGSGDEQVEWEAVFVPMYETLQGDKQYRRLIFRVEVPKDGWLAADVRFDGGRWEQVGIVKGKNGSVHMPIPLRRCDKFQIRLRGKGDCAVLEMAREFRLRGDG